MISFLDWIFLFTYLFLVCLSCSFFIYKKMNLNKKEYSYYYLQPEFLRKLFVYGVRRIDVESKGIITLREHTENDYIFILVEYKVNNITKTMHTIDFSPLGNKYKEKKIKWPKEVQNKLFILCLDTVELMNLVKENADRLKTKDNLMDLGYTHIEENDLDKIERMKKIFY